MYLCSSSKRNIMSRKFNFNIGTQLFYDSEDKSYKITYSYNKNNNLVIQLTCEYYIIYMEFCIDKNIIIAARPDLDEIAICENVDYKQSKIEFKDKFYDEYLHILEKLTLSLGKNEDDFIVINDATTEEKINNNFDNTYQSINN